jgi:hypothetical protein
VLWKKVESLKTELRTTISQKETSDMEKELAHAIENVEALKCEMQTAISEKKGIGFGESKD